MTGNKKKVIGSVTIQDGITCETLMNVDKKLFLIWWLYKKHYEKNEIDIKVSVLDSFFLEVFSFKNEFSLTNEFTTHGRNVWNVGKWRLPIQ